MATEQPSRTRHKPSGCLYGGRVVLITLLLLSPSAFAAGKWGIYPRAALGVIYSSNIVQESDTPSLGKVPDVMVLEFIPGFSIVQDGQQWQSELSYDLQVLNYTEFNNSGSGFDQQLDNADGAFSQASFISGGDLIRDRLSLTGRSSYGQDVVDPRTTLITSNDNITDRRTDVWTASITPELTLPIGSLAEFQASSLFGIVRYKEDIANPDLADSDIQSYSASLNSADREAIFNWDMVYEYEVVEYSDNLEDSLERVSLDAGYRLTQELRLVGLVGTEDNEFQRNSTDTVNGAYWNLGFRWQPTAQNNLELRAGKRDFGDVIAFNWSYTGSQLRLDAGYSENVTTTATLILNRDATVVEGAPVLNPGNPDLTGGAFVSKSFTSGVSYAFVNTNFSLGAFHQDREYLDNQGDEESTGVRIDIVSTLSARTDINIGAELRDETLRILDSPVRDFEDAKTWVVEAAWIRALGRNLGLRFSVAHREAKFSGGDEGNYDEDRVALQLIWNTMPDRAELQ